MSLEVERAIRDAIEASYYVSPESPGLLHEELLAVLAKVGLKKGEIESALAGRPLRDEIGRGQHGYRFRPDHLAHYLTSSGLRWTFQGDPRDRRVAAYLQEHLRELARERGVGKDLAQVAALIQLAVDAGCDERQARLAVRWLAWADLVTIDPQTLIVRGDLRLVNWKGAFVDEQEIDARNGFADLLKHVEACISARSVEARAAVLLRDLPPIETPVLESLERRVFEDVLSCFADRGEGRLLDDLVRALDDPEARPIALGRLVEQRSLLHDHREGRVVPSLLAVAQHPTHFVPLLLLADEALKRAKSLWQENQTRLPLRGPRGLLVSSPEDTQPERARALRQFDALLADLSFTPVLVPSGSASIVDVRDDIARLDSISKLIARKVDELARSRLVVQAAPSAVPQATDADSPRLTMTASSKEQARALLQRSIDEAEAMQGHVEPTDKQFEDWHDRTMMYVRRIFGEDSYQYRDLASIVFENTTMPEDPPHTCWYALEAAARSLTTFQHEVELFVHSTGAGPMQPIDDVVELLRRFPLAVRSLGKRWGGRPRLSMEDEHDVQYLLHALLVTRFEVIKPEEPTPSYVGAAGRMDFFLPQERLIIEVKMTREGLDEKKLRLELIEDLHTYSGRTDCSALVIFVYDPGQSLRNPAVFVNDLERPTTQLRVKVVIVP